MSSDIFHVVFVCTGNRARSAAAEGFLKQATAELPVRVSSAGLLDLEPGPALPEAVRACKEIGLDLSSHQSRPLHSIPLSDVDLLVGFEHQHVASAVVEGGIAYEKAFLLLELVALLEQLQPDWTGDVVADARRRLSRADELRPRPPVTQIGNEIADPLGKSESVFFNLATHIRHLIADLAAGLFGIAEKDLTALTESADL